MCYDAGKAVLAWALVLVTRRAIGGRKGVFRDYRLRVAAVIATMRYRAPPAGTGQRREPFRSRGAADPLTYSSPNKGRIFMCAE